jgi:inhibitor of KinA sporulation pathway (predicted exonuclease)
MVLNILQGAILWKLLEEMGDRFLGGSHGKGLGNGFGLGRVLKVLLSQPESCRSP